MGRTARAAPNPLGALAALGLLAQLGCASSPLRVDDPADRLIAALSSVDARERRDAARFLAQRGPETFARGGPAAEAALAHERDAEAAQRELLYLARTGTPEAHDVIARYQTHPNADVARAAFDALLVWERSRPPAAAPPPSVAPSRAAAPDAGAPPDEP